MSHVNRYSIKANPNKSSMSDGDKNTQAESGMGMPELPEAGGVSAETNQTKPKTKKAKAEKSDKPTKSTKSKSDRDPSQPRVKRGPARPHRRLDIDIIDSRITKLQKRLDRAKCQIEDASRHVEGYLRERDFRVKDGDLQVK